MTQPKYSPSAHTPSAGWSLVIDALAELGEWEIERRKRAAQQQAENAERAQDGASCSEEIDLTDYEPSPA